MCPNYNGKKVKMTKIHGEIADPFLSYTYVCKTLKVIIPHLRWRDGILIYMSDILSFFQYIFPCYYELFEV